MHLKLGQPRVCLSRQLALSQTSTIVDVGLLLHVLSVLLTHISAALHLDGITTVGPLLKDISAALHLDGITTVGPLLG